MIRQRFENQILENCISHPRRRNDIWAGMWHARDDQSREMTSKKLYCRTQAVISRRSEKKQGGKGGTLQLIVEYSNGLQILNSKTGQIFAKQNVCNKQFPSAQNHQIHLGSAHELFVMKLKALNPYKKTVKISYKHTATASRCMHTWTSWGLFQVLPTF